MSINSIAGKGLNYTASKLFAKQLDFARKNPEKFATNMMVLSLISKDVVNCAMYTYQSYNNKRIPEDKRTFVAALDLVQGFLNVGTQLFAYSIIKKKLTPQLFEKLIGSKLVKGLSNKYAKELQAKLPNKSLNEIKSELASHLKEDSDIYKAANTGFSLIVTLLVTNALCKRTIVPFIATPIAGKLKEKYEAKTSESAMDKADPLLSVSPLYNNKDKFIKS